MAPENEGGASPGDDRRGDERRGTDRRTAGRRPGRISGKTVISELLHYEAVKRRPKFAYIAFAVVMVVGGGYLGYQQLNQPAGLDGAIRKIGFYPISPPSVLTATGSIFHVTDMGHQYITVCRVRPEMIADKVAFSPTEKVTAQELSSASTDITAKLLSELAGEGVAKVVESINYSLTSVTVGEISSADLNGVFVELQKDPNCRNEVDRLLKLGEFVCQGQRILKASAQVGVNYSSDLMVNAEAKAEALEKVRGTVSASLGGETKITNNQIRSGKDLHYGIRVREFCLARADGDPVRLPRTQVGWYWKRVKDWARAVF
jgi:hypothetical protein